MEVSVGKRTHQLKEKMWQYCIMNFSDCGHFTQMHSKRTMQEAFPSAMAYLSKKKLKFYSLDSPR